MGEVVPELPVYRDDPEHCRCIRLQRRGRVYLEGNWRWTALVRIPDPDCEVNHG